MILIVGLGNPGQKFKSTRHNIGFRIVSEFRKKRNFSRFKSSKKFKSLISKGSLNRKRIVLAKPQTFMNNSGEAVKSLIENCKLTPKSSRFAQTTVQEIKNLFVVHDDVDLALGKIRISKGRGAGGHKGVQSVIDELGTKNFVRFRVGIRPVSSIKYQVLSRKLEEFVLKKFARGDEKIVKKVIKKTVEAVEISLKEGLEKAMQKFNK